MLAEEESKPKPFVIRQPFKDLNNLMNLSIGVSQLNIQKQPSSGFKVVAPTAKLAAGVTRENQDFFGAAQKDQMFKFVPGLNQQAVKAGSVFEQRQPFSVLNMNQKASEQPAALIADKVMKEEDVNADLKLVVKDVKKKLTYEELDDQVAQT